MTKSSALRAPPASPRIRSYAAVALVLAGCLDPTPASAPDPDVESGALSPAAVTISSTGGTIVALKASNGQYVSAQGGSSGSAIGVYANRAAIGPWEKLLVVPTGAGGYALLCQGDSSHRQYYVSAEGGGGGDVHCNRTTVGPWETFSLQRPTASSVAFRTSGGWYLSAQQGGGSGVDARRTAVGAWETFQLIAATTPSPGADHCVGAVGSNCDGIPVLAPCTTQGGVTSCQMSIGAMLHDSCCSNHPNGVNCGGKPSTTDCQDEWNHAEGDTAAGRQWTWRFNPALGTPRPYVWAYLKQSGGDLVGVATPAAIQPLSSATIWCGDAPSFCARGYRQDLLGDNCHCN